MIRRLAPRRLGTDEEATVVEHLSELRHRLLIAIAAIIPAFLLTFAFHTQLIEWLMRPLPEDTTLVTLDGLQVTPLLETAQGRVLQVSPPQRNASWRDPSTKALQPTSRARERADNTKRRSRAPRG